MESSKLNNYLVETSLICYSSMVTIKVAAKGLKTLVHTSERKKWDKNKCQNAQLLLENATWS
jgi:hypothetical protein